MLQEKQKLHRGYTITLERHSEKAWTARITAPDGHHVQTIPPMGRCYASEDLAIEMGTVFVDVEIQLEEHYAEVAAEWGI